MSTTNIMHPSANVQAWGTLERLKLQYYNIFFSNT